MQISIQDGPVPPSRPPGFALWNLGFRPFFLCAGLFAFVSILLWVARFAGYLSDYIYLPGPLWHAHEMIFGYTFAVVVGFLFTAVRNWTGSPTSAGRLLAAVIGLWIAARCSVAAGWPSAAAVADASFALSAAIGIAVPLYRGRNLRNAVFIALVLTLGAANLVFYVAMTENAGVVVTRDLNLGLHLILLIITVVGGRVIPMFTANAVAGAGPRRNVWVERAAIGSVCFGPVCRRDPGVPAACCAVALSRFGHHVGRALGGCVYPVHGGVLADSDSSACQWDERLACD